MRIVIIGGSFAGLTCAQKLSQLSPDTEVVVIDENKQGAYIPNGLNWYYQGRIRALRESLFLGDSALKHLPVSIHANHKVVGLDSHGKTLKIEHEGELKTLSYDKLVCAMGARPQSSYIEGADLPGVVTTKDYHSSQEAKAYLDKAKHLLIIGAGLVGLEACHTYAALGKTVTLIEAGPRLDFSHTDADMLPELLKVLEEAGVTVVVDERAKKITKTDDRLTVFTDHQSFDADAVLLAVNFRPNSQLLQHHVELAIDQTVVVDELMQTSAPDIYAIGDLVSQMTPSGQRAYIPLIGNAIRTAEQAAYGILGYDRKLLPSVEVVGHHIFGLYRFSIGETEEESSLYQDVISTIYKEPISFLDKTPLQLKLIVSKEDGHFIGAQVLSPIDVSPLVAQLVTIISHGLKDVDIVGQDFLVSFGQTDLYYHFHKAVQKVHETRLGLCKLNV